MPIIWSQRESIYLSKDEKQQRPLSFFFCRRGRGRDRGCAVCEGSKQVVNWMKLQCLPFDLNHYMLLIGCHVC